MEEVKDLRNGIIRLFKVTDRISKLSRNDYKKPTEELIIEYNINKQNLIHCFNTLSKLIINKTSPNKAKSDKGKNNGNN